MQVEDVTRIRLASRRAAQQQRQLAVSNGLLGQVVEDNQGVLSLVHPVLADRRPGVWRVHLQGGGVGGRGVDDDRVLQRPRLLQVGCDLGDRRVLLPDRNVDALHPGVGLVDDGVDQDGGLSGLPVADDQLALATPDRGQGVDRLDAGLQRFLDRLALHNRGCLGFEQPTLGGVYRPLPVDRVPQRVHDSAKERITDRHGKHPPRGAHLVTLLELGGLPHEHGTDLSRIEVERGADQATGELEELGSHSARQPGNGRHTVPNRGDVADGLCLHRRLPAFEVPAKCCGHVRRIERQL